MHTPGPWKAGPHAPSPRGHEGCPLAPSITLADGSGAMIASVNCGWPSKEACANARLIAAAPQLLEALEDLCGLIGEAQGDDQRSFRHVNWDGVLPDARAAYISLPPANLC